jgi:hypothetical protein
MRALVNDIYAKLDVKETIILGSVVDINVQKLEALVADYYGVSVHMLTAWQYDTEAKKMVCFLLHHRFNYSIGSIANHYKINRLHLKNCITKQYVDCLQDANKMAFVDGFINELKSNTSKALN